MTELQDVDLFKDFPPTIENVILPPEAIGAFANTQVEKPRRTLFDILQSLHDIETLMENPDFDPATIVGDIDATREDLKDKIDAIEYVYSELKAYAWRQAQKAQYYEAKADSAAANAENLRNRLKELMLAGKHEQLPGNKKIAKIVTHHTPSLKFTRDATADDMLNFGDKYVEVIPRSYDWKTEEFKQALMKGEITECLFASLEYSKRVEFKDADDPKVKKQRKQRAKK